MTWPEEQGCFEGGDKSEEDKKNKTRGKCLKYPVCVMRTMLDKQIKRAFME